MGFSVFETHKVRLSFPVCTRPRARVFSTCFSPKFHTESRLFVFKTRSISRGLASPQCRMIFGRTMEKCRQESRVGSRVGALLDPIRHAPSRRVPTAHTPTRSRAERCPELARAPIVERHKPVVFPSFFPLAPRERDVARVTGAQWWSLVGRCSRALRRAGRRRAVETTRTRPSARTRGSCL